MKVRVSVPSLTMKELGDIKKETGRSVLTEMTTRGARAFADEEIVTGLIWVTRRRQEPDLTYEEVLASLTVEDVSEAEIDFGKAPTPRKAPR